MKECGANLILGQYTASGYFDRIITGKELDKDIYKEFLDRGIEIELV
jgi:hypothetical protein